MWPCRDSMPLSSIKKKLHGFEFNIVSSDSTGTERPRQCVCSTTPHLQIDFLAKKCQQLRIHASWCNLREVHNTLKFISFRCALAEQRWISVHLLLSALRLVFLHFIFSWEKRGDKCHKLNRLANFLLPFFRLLFLSFRSSVFHRENATTRARMTGTQKKAAAAAAPKFE